MLALRLGRSVPARPCCCDGPASAVTLCLELAVPFIHDGAAPSERALTGPCAAFSLSSIVSRDGAGHRVERIELGRVARMGVPFRASLSARWGGSVRRYPSLLLGVDDGVSSPFFLPSFVSCHRRINFRDGPRSRLVSFISIWAIRITACVFKNKLKISLPAGQWKSTVRDLPGSYPPFTIHAANEKTHRKNLLGKKLPKEAALQRVVRPRPVFDHRQTRGWTRLTLR